jgi:acetyl esterase
VSGESGGANLSIATAMKAKQDNKMDQIDGVYAMCPFIYGRYNFGDAEEAKLPSLAENDGLFLNLVDMQMLASCYLPVGEDARNHPLAWPYWTTEEDLRGLPPHVITVNELDPLRSEGLAHYRKLMRAGVKVRCHTVCGTVHAGDLLFMGAIPDITNATLSDLLTFTNEV